MVELHWRQADIDEIPMERRARLLALLYAKSIRETVRFAVDLGTLDDAGRTRVDLALMPLEPPAP